MDFDSGIAFTKTIDANIVEVVALCRQKVGIMYTQAKQYANSRGIQRDSGYFWFPEIIAGRHIFGSINLQTLERFKLFKYKIGSILNLEIAAYSLEEEEVSRYLDKLKQNPKEHDWRWFERNPVYILKISSGSFGRQNIELGRSNFGRVCLDSDGMEQKLTLNGVEINNAFSSDKDLLQIKYYRLEDLLLSESTDPDGFKRAFAIVSNFPYLLDYGLSQVLLPSVGMAGELQEGSARQIEKLHNFDPNASMIGRAIESEVVN